MTEAGTKRLAGRVALVTGGSRGVGRAIALRLGAEGALVAVNYRRDEAAADEVVQRIQADGGRAQAFRASTADPAATAAMAEQIAQTFGPVDLFVSNAGTASRGRTVEQTHPDEFLEMLKVHALGPVALIQVLLPGMRKAARADIIMISSALTDSAPPNGAPYTMAKAAMEAAMRTLAREERRHGLHVNIVAPGLVATDMGAKLIAATTGETNVESVAADFPFGRICAPEDVAGAVAFLASADSGYITGQRVLIDGGGPDVSIMHNI